MDVDQISPYMECSSRMLKPLNILAQCLPKKVAIGEYLES